MRLHLAIAALGDFQFQPAGDGRSRAGGSADRAGHRARRFESACLWRAGSCRPFAQHPVAGRRRAPHRRYAVHLHPVGLPGLAARGWRSAAAGRPSSVSSSRPSESRRPAGRQPGTPGRVQVVRQGGARPSLSVNCDSTWNGLLKRIRPPWCFLTFAWARPRTAKDCGAIIRAVFAPAT